MVIFYSITAFTCSSGNLDPLLPPPVQNKVVLHMTNTNALMLAAPANTSPEVNKTYEKEGTTDFRIGKLFIPFLIEGLPFSSL